jgi:hypothetical protein
MPHLLVAPVVRQQVVEHVVDGDRAEQPARSRRPTGRGDQVVRREVLRDPAQRVGRRRAGSRSVSITPPTIALGGSRSSRWMWQTPR